MIRVKQYFVWFQDYEESRGLVTATTVAILPVLFFFTFLYYTDTGSTFCVLLTYLLSLHGNQVLAAMAGVLAIMFRQTNVVWVAFVAGVVVSDKIMDFIQPDKKDISEEKQQDIRFLSVVVKQVFGAETSRFNRLLLDILKGTWAYILVGVAFIMFIAINGSIVVGAKDDHQVALHFPQLFYFAGFTGVFGFMHLVSVNKFKDYYDFLTRNRLFVMGFYLISILLVWNFTYAHRYLLSDNRHYTFYVWARIYQRHDLIKYGLVPCYLYTFWSMATCLQDKNILWKCVFCLCVATNLVPSMLLEFRYFIIPYLIFRLNMPLASYFRLITEMVFYIAVNVLTLYIFIAKPFRWMDSQDVQRFMW